MKLWDKGYVLDDLIENFTVGDDPELDTALMYYDCIGSIAHAHMLMHCGVITESEFLQLKKVLVALSDCAKKGTFSLSKKDEDVHTAIENRLVAELGDVGKKIHTARSRNDQVLLDIRMYMRDELLEVFACLLALSQELIKAADKYQDVPMVGRTHFQRAMPSSMGLFFASYAEALLDDHLLIKSSFELINQCPLGSAASYGVALPINRQLVADSLGFDRVQNNVLYANNSRGKFESIVLHALTQIMITLSKLSTDLIIFGAPEFGYITIPQELCSGSSLMPQKRNPCGLELVRAKSATVVAHLMQTLMVIRALPSGYNRDFQETKKPLMESFEITKRALNVLCLTIQKITVNKDTCLKAFEPEVFATDTAIRLINDGYSFREAYKIVATQPERVVAEDPVANIKSKKHQGATGNLGLELNYARIAKAKEWADAARDSYQSAITKLLSG